MHSNDDINDLDQNGDLPEGNEQEGNEQEGNEGEAAEGKSIVAKHYQDSYTKSAYGSKTSKHNGGTLASALDGYSVADITRAAAQQIEGLEGKWSNLNPGQRRMNVGNAIRFAIKKGEFDLAVLIDALVECPRGLPAKEPKAPKAAKEVVVPEAVLDEEGTETKASIKKRRAAEKKAARAKLDADNQAAEAA